MEESRKQEAFDIKRGKFGEEFYRTEEATVARKSMEDYRLDLSEHLLGSSYWASQTGVMPYDIAELSELVKTKAKRLASEGATQDILDLQTAFKSYQDATNEYTLMIKEYYGE